MSLEKLSYVFDNAFFILNVTALLRICGAIIDCVSILIEKKLSKAQIYNYYLYY